MKRGHNRRAFATTGLALAAMMAVLPASPARALKADESRIKDLAFLEGTSPEPLVGYGLVIGLNGTGDSPKAGGTSNSLATLLERLDVTVAASDLKAKNVAEVMVTAELDPNTSVGGRVDVKVSSLNDAGSLEGGTLVMTPLKSMDGVVRIIAQGSVSLGGFNVNAGSGNSVRKNHAQSGIISNGGTVRVAFGGSWQQSGRLAWLLHSPDFSTAAAVAGAISAEFGAGTALARDAQRVEVVIPAALGADPVTFVAAMGQLASTSDATARVVLNERTGTIIVGKNVKLKEAAVAHGTLKVIVSTLYDVSQPNPFSTGGQTTVTPDVRADATEHEARVLRVPDTSTVADVVGVLNEIGATPRDIIAILEALKQAGSLQADLVIM
ncbi:MAG: flagellar basal body P-ring protein FlgI [bacterium]|nr:flagellar basal body P-ring protein FlgI [bacterium]